MKTIKKDRLQLLELTARRELTRFPQSLLAISADELLLLIHELKARRRQCSKPRGDKHGI